MRHEGLRIEGFCVAAGIPSTEKAAEIISGLLGSVMSHFYSKPGSVDGIRQVVNIVAANPDLANIIQWAAKVTAYLKISISPFSHQNLPS